MSDFALPVVRVVVPLNPWSISPFLAKQRERYARQALSLRPGQRLYCRFEKRQGDLECAFSAGDPDTVRKPLLGETVRDWLGRHAGDDFLWCEAVADGLALTLVVGGHVAKDGVYSNARVAQELRLALSQLLRRDAPVEAYYGNSGARRHVEDVLTGLDTDAIAVLPAPNVLQGHLDRVVPPTLTEVSEIPEIRAWDRTWQLVRYAFFAALLGSVALLGYWSFEQLTGGQVVQEPPDRVKRIYAKLLVAPPAGDLLLDIHKNYRDFVGDEVFADFSRVTQLEWAGARVGTAAVADAPSALTISASLAVTDDDWNGRQQARVFPNRLRDHAVRRGWDDFVWDPSRVADRPRGPNYSVAGAVAWFTVSRALERVVVRDIQQGLANQRPPPVSDEGVTSRTVGLEEVLADVGTVEVIGTRPSEVFETTEVQLWLANVAWLDRDVVEWIAVRLDDLPVVLDSVELTTVEAGGAEDGTTIRMRLVWCIAAGGTCVEPLTEADFLSSQTATDA